MEISEILKQQKNFFKTKQTLPYSYRIGANLQISPQKKHCLLLAKDNLRMQVIILTKSKLQCFLILLPAN